ncbi:hypothetical protein BC628DRAFT_230250 [Trametes gibbosa]|nr:hypothetical protein BC628DRAFT_230250 [Trametes gibbosa]
MEAPKPAMTTSSQPQAVQMSMMNPPARQSTQVEEAPKRGLAARLRGGGAGKVSCSSYSPPCGTSLTLRPSLGLPPRHGRMLLVLRVLQSESVPGPRPVRRFNTACQDCCECFADIVCCPCEMCC